MIETTKSAGGAIATIELDNPPLHVLTVQLRQRLFEAVAGLAADDDVKVVIVQARGGRAFSAGSDVREFPSDELGGLAKIQFEQSLLNRIERLPALTIAKVDGAALGGGGELVLACDFRIASIGSTFGFPEIRLGALPAAGGMKRLMRDVGSLRARELGLLGRPVDAEHAERIGLINRAVDCEELDAVVDELADHLIRLPAGALRHAKRLLCKRPDADFDRLEAEAFGALFSNGDLAEGVSAFLEKRPPRFGAARRKR